METLVTDRVAHARKVAQGLGALFGGMQIPAVAITREGNFVSANDAAIKQYGWSLEELVEMGVGDLLETEVSSLGEELSRAYSAGLNDLPPRAHRRKDGSLVWAVPSASPVVVEGETLVVCILKDVTPLLHAEQRARGATESNLNDRQTVLNAVVAMLGERELRPALALLARSFGQAIGRSTTVWLPAGKGSRTLTCVAWHDLSEEGRETITSKQIDLDRERYARLAWDTGAGYAVRLGDLEEGTLEHATVARLGMGVVAPLMGREGPHGLLYGIPRPPQDMTRAVMLATTLGLFGGMVLEAVQLEARVETMWQAAGEQLTDGITLIDADLRVVRMNDAELRLIGKSESEVLGQRCVDVFNMCEGVTECPHRRALADKQRSVQEIVGRHSGRPLRVEVIPAQNDETNVALIQVVHDLSEERAIRSELVASDRLASIGRLAAGVAHEINNPAAFVTVNLGVLRDRFQTGTARARDVLAMLDESLNGMNRIRDIVGDLKGLARDRSVEDVDLGAIAQSAVRMAAHETRGRAHVERVSEPGAVARVRGARVSQVVLNLVLNAAQALPPGRRENRIEVRTLRAGDRAHVEVADNGPGIDARIAGRIFEPFFTTREKSGGTGLGLWLARSIVEEEGGTLTFRPERGGGTRFIVDLPAADRAGSPAVHEPGNAHPTGGARGAGQ
jgi:PAS domain S-box-containing protein